MPQPKPSQLNRGCPRSRITGFTDALIAPALTTVERGRCEPDVAADLAAIDEGSIEDLPRQHSREDRANTPELAQEFDFRPSADLV